MDDLIAIRTSDDPPVDLTAARAVLMAGSRVFADMLSLPQGDSMRTNRATLPNLVNEPGDPFEELRDEEWMAVVSLSDKYDAPSVRRYAMGEYWRPRGRRRGSTTRFMLATTLDDPKELKTAALRVAKRVLWPENALPGVPTPWVDSMRDWAYTLAKHAIQQLVDHPPAFRLDTCACDPTEVLDHWYSSASRALLSGFMHETDAPFHRGMEGSLDESKFCAAHCRRFDDMAYELDWAYHDSIPDFPL